MDYRERWELKDYLTGRRLERRILLLHGAFGLVLLTFLFNFWYLQGVKGDEYAVLAENNRMRRIPLPPTRGVIYDRNGEVVASTRPALGLFLIRESEHDLTRQIEALAPILEVPAEKIHERWKAMRGRPLYEPLLLNEDVSLEQIARIEARRERFPSVEIRETARRHYPEGGTIAHVVGYVGQVNESELEVVNGGRLGDIVGKSGVERAFDARLRGLRGWQLVSVNSLGRRIGDARVDREPDHGNPLRLTLDMSMQRALQEGLGDEAGAGVFLDARTGAVLAMVSTPSFDPNLFADGFTRQEWSAIVDDPQRPLHDRAIASFYAPGSTFKVVMAVAGLETGTVKPNDRTFCNGSKTFYGRRQLCWKRGGHGWVDLDAALAHSCNVYFYGLGQELGIDKIHASGAVFGLGRQTGIDLPGEEVGVLPSREWKLRTQGEGWYPGDTISVAIGQGYLAVTPVQLAAMMAAVATGETPPTPHLHEGGAMPRNPLPVSQETLRTVRLALKRAVDSGTGREATLGKFSAAGKTGTAQVYRHSAGVDSDDLPKSERDHAWFVGYAPAQDPAIAFAVVVEHGGHGGSSAAPIVRRVLEVFFAEPAPADAEVAGRRRKGGGRGPTQAAR